MGVMLWWDRHLAGRSSSFLVSAQECVPGGSVPHRNRDVHGRPTSLRQPKPHQVEPEDAEDGEKTETKLVKSKKYEAIQIPVGGIHQIPEITPCSLRFPLHGEFLSFQNGPFLSSSGSFSCMNNQTGQKQTISSHSHLCV